MMGLIVIIGVGFMNLFFVSKGMELLISGAAAALFSLFIVYDTHVSVFFYFIALFIKKIDVKHSFNMEKYIAF